MIEVKFQSRNFIHKSAILTAFPAINSYVNKLITTKIRLKRAQRIVETSRGYASRRR